VCWPLCIGTGIYRPLTIKVIENPDLLSAELKNNYDLVLADCLFENPTGEEVPRLDDIIAITQKWSKTNRLDRPLPIIAYTRREKGSLDYCLGRRDALFDIWDILRWNFIGRLNLCLLPVYSDGERSGRSLVPLRSIPICEASCFVINFSMNATAPTHAESVTKSRLLKSTVKNLFVSTGGDAKALPMLANHSGPAYLRTFF